MHKVATRKKAETAYTIGERVRNHASHGSCEQQVAPPGSRPLRIFTLDPSVSDRLGGVATVNVPYELLQPGPVGTRFEFDPSGAPEVLGDVRLDLDEPALLRSSGLSPTPASGRFHLQMAYAVCNLTYAAFRRALGREIDWACGVIDPVTKQRRLKVKPFKLALEQNAYYDRGEDGLVFGYFKARRSPAGHTVPGGLVFTGLSHDILVHETTHALLDALRSEFFVPTHSDVLGFHEGFADIIALLQHFSYPDVVEKAIRESSGSLSRSALLSSIAQEFGNAMSSTEHPAPLRTSVDLENIMAFDADLAVPDARNRRGMLKYKPDMEEHDMGAVLLAAVFEAFVTIFRRKSERYYRIAGISPHTDAPNLSSELTKVLAQEASEIASRFLDICIRAIDYCPPVDLELGEYLRALITADSELVADDRWGYREALMRSFRRRSLFPERVQFMTEDAVRWNPCDKLRIPGLAFRDLRFSGDPGSPADPEEMMRQANTLGAFISDPDHAGRLRLLVPGSRSGNVSNVAPPTIQSIRCARRVAPDGRVLFDLIAEVTQTATVRDGRLKFQFSGGATIVIDPCGYVRYAIHKKLDSAERQERSARAIRGPLADYWSKDGQTLVPGAKLLARLHTATPRRKTTLRGNGK